MQSQIQDMSKLSCSQSAYCGRWGHLVNLMKRERTSKDIQYQGLLPEYLDLQYIASIQDTMGAMYPCMVSILDFCPRLKTFHFHTLLLWTIEWSHWLTWDTSKVSLLVRMKNGGVWMNIRQLPWYHNKKKHNKLNFTIIKTTANRLIQPQP